MQENNHTIIKIDILQNMSNVFSFFFKPIGIYSNIWDISITVDVIWG